MKKIFTALILAMASTGFAAPPGYCEVKICNKLERFSLDPTNWMKDKWGEQCFDSVIPKADAVEGKVLSSESRWYQGSSINPTKKSVTRIKSVKNCG
jgi:hypothetical protein